jgi:phytoene synthase
MSAQGASDLLTSSKLSSDVILSRAEGENFPVVLWGLPRSLRGDLLALYAYARLVDQVGDEVEGDRTLLLDALSRDLLRIPDSEPEHPILQKMAPVVRRHGLRLETLERLIEANRRDQDLRRVSSWDELVETCTRSANPVGELVLGILGRANDRTIRLSDSICTALQVVEHCQDVAEDFRSGRVYLPADDMSRFGCREEDLASARSTIALEQTIRLQVERARELLAESDELLSQLCGIGLPLVAAYAAGGLATCDALERHGFDVVSSDVRPARRDFLRHWLSLLWRSIRLRMRS